MAELKAELRGDVQITDLQFMHQTKMKKKKIFKKSHSFLSTGNVFSFVWKRLNFCSNIRSYLVWNTAFFFLHRYFAGYNLSCWALGTAWSMCQGRRQNPPSLVPLVFISRWDRKTSADHKSELVKGEKMKCPLVGCLTASSEGRYFPHVPYGLIPIPEKNTTPGGILSKDMMCHL